MTMYRVKHFLCRRFLKIDDGVRGSFYVRVIDVSS